MKTENAKWKKWMRLASSLTAVTILLFSSIGQAQARILFEDDTYFNIQSEGIILDYNDNIVAGTASTLVDQTITYTADAVGVAGDNISITIVETAAGDLGGDNATIAITATGDAITVTFQDDNNANPETVGQLDVVECINSAVNITTTASQGATPGNGIACTVTNDVTGLITATGGTATTDAVALGTANLTSGADGDSVVIQFGSDGSDALISYNDTTQDITLSTPGGDFDFSDDSITTTGALLFESSSEFHIREVANEAAADCTALDEIVLDTTENRIYICTATGSPGTWVAADSGSSQDFDNVYDISQGAGNLTMEIDNGSLNFNITTADSFTIQDGGNNIAEFTGAGAVLFDPTSGQNFDATTLGAGDIILSSADTVDIDGANGIFLDSSAGDVTVNAEDSVTIASLDAGNTGAENVTIGSGSAAPDAGEDGDDIALEAEDDVLLEVTDDVDFDIGDAFDLFAGGLVNMVSDDASLTFTANDTSANDDDNIVFSVGDTAPDAGENGNDVVIEAEDAFLVETSGAIDFDAAGAFTLNSTTIDLTSTGAGNDITFASADDIIFNDLQLASPVQMTVSETGIDAEYGTTGIIDAFNLLADFTAGDGSDIVGVEDASLTYIAAVRADLLNQTITYTADTGGTGGNAITVTLVETAAADLGGDSATIDVAVVGNAITVTFQDDNNANAETVGQIDIIECINSAASITTSGNGATAGDGIACTITNDATGLVTASGGTAATDAVALGAANLTGGLASGLPNSSSIQDALERLDIQWGDLYSEIGATLVGIEDVDNNFTATDVEGALTEIGTAIGINGVDLTFYPEYPDATVWADGSANKGTLEGLYDTAQDTNYYNWTTSKAALQDINIQFMFILPPDFSTVGANGLQFEYRTGTGVNTDNKVDVKMYERTGAGTTVACGSDLANVNNAGAGGVFATGQITKAAIDGGCALTAGDVILIEVILYDNSGAADFADVGYITLDYDN